MYPVFGVRGPTYFVGRLRVAVWGGLVRGILEKKRGVLGALGEYGSFIATSTIIPLMPDGWAASAGVFQAMREHVSFLMKDPVLFAISFYLLKED